MKHSYVTLSFVLIFTGIPPFASGSRGALRAGHKAIVWGSCPQSPFNGGGHHNGVCPYIADTEVLLCL